MDTLPLSELQWLDRFKVEPNGNLLLKSALKQGNKIFALNPFGNEPLLLEPSTPVILIQKAIHLP